jgi:heme/copper-type cytochrome/quinol oxidase subunit 2
MMGYYNSWGMMGWWFVGGCIFLLLIALMAYFAWTARRPS